MASLASELLRFELRGARATSVLNEVISPLSSPKAENQKYVSTTATPQSAAAEGSETVASSTVDKEGDVAMSDNDGTNTTEENTDFDCGASAAISRPSEVRVGRIATLSSWMKLARGFFRDFAEASKRKGVDKKFSRRHVSDLSANRLAEGS